MRNLTEAGLLYKSKHHKAHCLGVGWQSGPLASASKHGRKIEEIILMSVDDD